MTHSLISRKYLLYALDKAVSLVLWKFRKIDSNLPSLFSQALEDHFLIDISSSRDTGLVQLTNRLAHEENGDASSGDLLILHPSPPVPVLEGQPA